MPSDDQISGRDHRCEAQALAHPMEHAGYRGMAGGDDGVKVSGGRSTGSTSTTLRCMGEKGEQCYGFLGAH